MNPLKYFARGAEVFLSGMAGDAAKPICTAASNRLAQKIAANMNLMESQKQKAHEIFMHGTGNPKRGRQPL